LDAQVVSYSVENDRCSRTPYFRTAMTFIATRTAASRQTAALPNVIDPLGFPNVIFVETQHREVRLSQPGDHTDQITSAMFTPISGVMQHLDLSDEEAAALIKELADITGNDRYPFSSRIQTLRAILGKLRPEPVREPLPPPKVYAPTRATAARRRR
jgi:hypothetical protein